MNNPSIKVSPYLPYEEYSFYCEIKTKREFKVPTGRIVKILKIGNKILMSAEAYKDFITQMTTDDELPFPADNEIAPTVEEIKAEYHKSVKSAFDFDKVMRFCQDNRVEVLFQSDQQFHCFINYSKEEGKHHSRNPYHIDVDALSAMVFGINTYLEEEKALIEAESFKNTNK